MTTFVAVAGNQTINGDPNQTDTIDMVNAGTGGAFVNLASGQAFSSATGFDTLNSIENVSGSAGDDAFFGNGVANVFFATTGQDVIDGAAGDDTFDASTAATAVSINLNGGGTAVTGAFTASLTSIENALGGSGADTFTLSAANNVVGGGAGTDTAIVAGAISTIVANGSGYTVTSAAGGTDTLTSVEIVDDAGAGRILLVGSGGFASIQAAVDAAQDGDTILVAAGTYVEQVVVDDLDNLTIRAAGNGAVTIEAPASLAVTGTSDTFGSAVRANLTVIGSLGFAISGITIDGSFAGDTTTGANGDEITGIALLNSSGSIDDVLVQNVSNSPAGGLFGLQHGSGILIDNGGTTGPLLAVSLTDSTITDFQKTGLIVFNTDATVTGNTITGIGATDLTAQNGIQIGRSQGTVDGNNVSGLAYTVPSGGTVFESSGIIAYEPSGALAITGNTFTGSTGGRTTAVDLSDVANGTLVTITGNTFDTVENGIFGYTFDASLGLDSDPAISGNTFLNIEERGVFFDPELVLSGGSFSTNTAFDVTGSDFSDVLRGSNGNDSFTGGDGADVLDGRAGVDTVAGGAGDDAYTVDDSTDVVVEAAGEGTDTVSSSVTYSLAGQFIENLTLTGSADISGTGNSLANVITGNTGANTLTGGGANDTIDGGAGIDTASYSDAVTASNIAATASGFTVTTASGGTDTLSNVEIVDGPEAGRILLVGNGGFGTLQAAINAAADGDTILLAPGALADSGSVTVDKDVTILGFYNGVDGADSSRAASSESVLNGGLNITAAGVTVDGLRVVGGAMNSGNSSGIYVSADDVTITNSILEAGSTPADYGFLTPSGGGVTGLLIDGNLVTGWEVGGYFNPTTQFVVSDNTFTGYPNGNAFQGDGWATGTLIQGNTFSDTNFSTVGYSVTGPSEDVGAYVGSNTYIDSGLSGDRKIGIYLVGDGVSDGDGQNVTGTAEGDYIVSYATAPAGSGEANDTIDGAGGDDYLEGGDGNDLLVAGIGNDILDGSGGFDTASFSGNQAGYAIASSAGGFTVTDTNTADGDDGTDTLTGVEFLTFADSAGARTLYVDDDGSAGFTTIQAAVDAAQDGDTIVVLAGTYRENVTIADKALTLLGANAGVDGAGTRGAESTLYGRILVTGSDDVTLDGFEVRADAATGTTGPSNPALEFRGTGDDVITNTIFYNETIGGNSEARAIGVYTSFTGTASIDSNLFTGASTGNFGTAPWQRGIWSDGTSSDLDITGNTFNHVRSSMNLDGYNDATHEVSGNIFQAAGTGIAVGIPTGSSFTGIHDNDFQTVGDDFNFQNVLTQSINLDLGATNNASSTSVMQVLGGQLNDSIKGSAGSDVLLGNAGADTLDGAAGVDSLSGGAGNYRLIAGAGSDTLNGGADLDTAVFSGNQAGYTITSSAGSYTVTDINTADGDDGTDTLVGVEFLSFADSAGARTLYVDDNGGSPFTTIQAAVDAAQDGDTIIVLAGTYTEQVVVNGKNNLTIAASGPGVSVVAPVDVVQTATASNGRAINGVITVLNATNVTLDGFMVDGAGHADTVDGQSANFVGVAYRNASGTLDGVDITGIRDPYPGGTVAGGGPVVSGNQRGVGVQVDNDTQLAFTMTGGSITDFQKNATVFNGAILNVTGVTVTGGGAQTINAQNGFQATNSTGTISGNTITGIGYAGPQNLYSGAILTFGNTNLNIQNNTIVGTNGASTDAKVIGIYVLDFGTPNSGGTISGNVISFVDEGIDVSGLMGPNGVVVGPNTVNNIDLTDQFAAGLFFDGSQTSVPLSVTGTNAADLITGGGGNDTIAGGTGNDLIDGGAGADALAGNAGDDTFVVDNPGDTVAEAAGEGTDTVRSSVTFSLAGQFLENLTLTGTANISGTGNSLANVITGNDGANTLAGGGANDTIDGGAGVDRMLGGTGNDVFIVDNTNDVTVEAANEGTDEVRASANFSLAGQFIENLILTGTAAINGTGNSLDNFIRGNDATNLLDGGVLNGVQSGNDTLDGGLGADTMVGRQGDDTYVVDNTMDVVVEAANEGTDIVFSSASSYTLGSQFVENLTLTGAAVSGTGNSAANVITGTSANNTLDGGSVNGLSGNDTLDGGLGNDTMFGRGGDDTFYVDASGDVAVEALNEGTDTVFSSVSYSLAGQYLEILRLTGTATTGTGNSLDNLIVGTGAANVLDGAGGNDTLDGGVGADTMFGRTGNDTYFVDNGSDVAVEADGEGTDTVISSISYSLGGQFLENLTLTGTAVTGNGNSLNNRIVGTSGNNILDGGSGGNDTLDGGAGADTMTGRSGNDTYIVDNTGDVAVEAINEGTDTVLSSVTYSLAGQYLENLTLTGTNGVNGTGNSLANVLVGNGGNNVLNGGSANDTLDGGLGADTLIGDVGQDTFRFSTALGSGNVDNITLMNTIDDTIALSNTVFVGLGTGPLASTAFKANGPSDADDRILYDQSTGTLFFDQDGSGASFAAVAFAVLDNKPVLAASSFVVYDGLMA